MKKLVYRTAYRMLTVILLALLIVLAPLHLAFNALANGLKMAIDTIAIHHSRIGETLWGKDDYA